MADSAPSTPGQGVAMEQGRLSTSSMRPDDSRVLWMSTGLSHEQADHSDQTELTPGAGSGTAAVGVVVGGGVGEGVGDEVGVAGVAPSSSAVVVVFGTAAVGVVAGGGVGEGVGDEVGVAGVAASSSALAVVLELPVPFVLLSCSCAADGGAGGDCSMQMPL